MADGKYSAISGSVGRMENLNRISEQLAAAKNSGYKKVMVTFESELGEANSGMASEAANYTRLTRPQIDFSQGPFEYNDNPLNVAINGDGFFKIRLPDDSFGYTRKGNFQLNGEGRLVDIDGFPVLGSDDEEILLPYPDVQIATDGSIWSKDAQVGKLAVYDFADKSVLGMVRGEMFAPTDETVQAEVMAHPVLEQNSLEGSNINVMRTMANMTTNLRAFESLQKALKIYSDMDSKAAEIGQLA